MCNGSAVEINMYGSKICSNDVYIAHVPNECRACTSFVFICTVQIMINNNRNILISIKMLNAAIELNNISTACFICCVNLRCSFFSLCLCAYWICKPFKLADRKLCVIAGKGFVSFHSFSTLLLPFILRMLIKFARLNEKDGSSQILHPIV